MLPPLASMFEFGSTVSEPLFTMRGIEPLLEAFPALVVIELTFKLPVLDRLNVVPAADVFRVTAPVALLSTFTSPPREVVKVRSFPATLRGAEAVPIDPPLL